jgi:hypothetical protein
MCIRCAAVESSQTKCTTAAQLSHPDIDIIVNTVTYAHLHLQVTLPSDCSLVVRCRLQTDESPEVSDVKVRRFGPAGSFMKTFWKSCRHGVGPLSHPFAQKRNKTRPKEPSIHHQLLHIRNNSIFGEHRPPPSPISQLHGSSCPTRERPADGPLHMCMQPALMCLSIRPRPSIGPNPIAAYTIDAWLSVTLSTADTPVCSFLTDGHICVWQSVRHFARGRLASLGQACVCR